ncbi:MAG: 4Fe-4S binding protein [Syntrophaceae bacterium]|nr:4Fe-4S binding protein [Syntrophaceae bacterium]
MSNDVYKKLGKHLSALGMGYPDKDELIPILEANFSPFEAEVALAIPTGVIPLEAVSVAGIAGVLQMPAEQITPVLENLARRGLLFSKKLDDGTTGYALHQFGYGFPQTFFWGGIDAPNAKATAEMIVKYSRLPDLEWAYGSTPSKAYRFLPAAAALDPDSHAVFPFEMMEEVIKKVTTIAIVHCPCRATMELLGKRQCHHALEACIKYDDLAEYLLDTGIGRKISPDEALNVIKKCEEAGLVHLVDNAREGIKHTCNCCGCCCWSVGTIRRRKIPRDVLMATYFIRDTDAAECTGCGLCVDICPVNAIRMENDFPVVDPDWCIGCGVCAVPCPTSAVRLIRRGDALPPKDFQTLHNQILYQRKDYKK